MTTETADFAIDCSVVDANVASHLAIAHAVDNPGKDHGIDVGPFLPIGCAEGLGREGASA